MKKITLLIFLALTNLSVADNLTSEVYNPKPMIEGNRRVDELIEWNKNHPGEMPPLTEQEKYEFFIKKGMPVPGSGASVVNIKDLKITHEQSEEVNKFNSDQKNKGYYQETNKKAKLLLSMPETAEKEYIARRAIAYNPQDTHLYEVKSHLAMNYDYKGVPQALVTKVIGYAPESIFVNNGWAGAVEYFIPTFGGVCAFHEVNIEITKSAAYIPKEIATYLVNSKITTMNIVGNEEYGFVYEIEWWDKKFKRTLECALQEYTNGMRKSTIKLAKKIDFS